MSISKITIQDGKMSMIFDFKEINYISFHKMYSCCNFTNGKELKINTDYNRLKELFPQDQFLCVTNAFIININEIKSITKMEDRSRIKMKNKISIYIEGESRKFLTQFKVY